LAQNELSGRHFSDDTSKLKQKPNTIPQDLFFGTELVTLRLMQSILCLTTLLMAALAPTTSHQQLRDSDGRAWMLIRSKKVLVLHAPEAGQLQLLARSAGAKLIRIRAAGEVLASEPLATGKEAGLPGKRLGPKTLLRIPVPSGGEIYRIEVPRGRAWVAVSLLKPSGVVAFEQPEATTPGLVSLGAITENPAPMPGLVGLGALPSAPKKAAKMPVLVQLDDRQAKREKALSLGARKERSNLPSLKPLVAAKAKLAGPAVIDRPITELGDENKAPRLAQTEPAKAQKWAPELPKGPTLMERLATMQLGMSFAGSAHGRADRLGGQVEIEIDLPGSDKLLAAALYMGFAPSGRSAVARSGQGVALPITVSQSTSEVPLGLTLRARPMRLSVANRKLSLIAEINAGWHLRSSETTVGMVSASLRQPITELSSSGGLTGGLGVGAEMELRPSLLLGLHARVETSQGAELELNDLLKTQFSQSGASMAVSLRYRFGS
jgi:hypothetical protein